LKHGTNGTNGTRGTNGTNHRAAGNAVSAPSDVELYTARALMALVGNSTRRWCLNKAAELVALGVLRKDGRRWVGSRSAVIAALMGAL
jgi:hypothetical protein